MKPKLSLKGRGLQLLAQREHSRLELRRKLMRYAIAECKAREAAEAEAARDGHALGSRAAPASPAFDVFVGAEDGSIHTQDGGTDDDATVSAAILSSTSSTSAVAPTVAPGAAYSPHGRSNSRPASKPGVHTPAVFRASGLLAGSRSPGPAAVADASQARARAKGQGPEAPVPPADSPTAAELVEAVLDWLQARAYLSEERFVESRVHARAARFGNQRIRQELAQHGVTLAPAELQALKDSELARARVVWARKFGHQPVDAAERGRQMRFLAGRGFSGEVVRRVVQGNDDD